MNSFADWQARHPVAAAELLQVLDHVPGIRDDAGSDFMTEAGLQSALRLQASKYGIWTARNNSGVFINPAGVPVRFGLANDSKKLNVILKSSDLIGCKPELITYEMVGKIFGRFWARECKKPSWVYSGTPREVGQLNFINLINSKGGDAKFATSPEDI